MKNKKQRLTIQERRRLAYLMRQRQIAEEVAEGKAYKRMTHPLFKKNKNRNEKCFCGSGKKFKKCCLRKVPRQTAFIPTKRERFYNP